jgi:transcriptional regulator with XRE-family HTH domain
MINTTGFNSRLELILKHYGLSASVFAEKISVQRSSISHILSGRNKPSLDFIDKVLQVFPEIDLVWLLSGKGNLHNTTPLDQPGAAKPPVETQPSTSSVINDSEGIDRIVIFYQDGSFKNYKMNTKK